MSLIQDELKDIGCYAFKKISGTDLVLLCRENVTKVEAAIRNDSSYRKSSDPEACPDGKYEGSTAFWMTQLKDILVKGNHLSTEGYDL